MHYIFCKMKHFTEKEILEILNEIDPNDSDLEDDNEVSETTSEMLLNELHPDDELIIDQISHNNSTVLLKRVSLLNVEEESLEGDILFDQTYVFNTNRKLNGDDENLMGLDFTLNQIFIKF